MHFLILVLTFSTMLNAAVTKNFSFQGRVANYTNEDLNGYRVRIELSCKRQPNTFERAAAQSPLLDQYLADLSCGSYSVSAPVNQDGSFEIKDFKVKVKSWKETSGSVTLERTLKNSASPIYVFGYSLENEQFLETEIQNLSLYKIQKSVFRPRLKSGANFKDWFDSKGKDTFGDAFRGSTEYVYFEGRSKAKFPVIEDLYFGFTKDLGPNPTIRLSAFIKNDVLTQHLKSPVLATYTTVTEYDGTFPDELLDIEINDEYLPR